VDKKGRRYGENYQIQGTLRKTDDFAENSRNLLLSMKEW